MSNPYDPECFDALATLEDGNYWFINRNRLILWFIKRYCPGMRHYLEVGCGTGYVLSAIATHFPEAEICGTEMFKEGIAYAEKRTARARFLPLAAEDLAFEKQFDLAGAFDVIEHIENDVLALRRIHAALKSGGHMLLTVPQHRFLWSAADDYARHQRRYSRKELVRKVESAGFDVVRTTSFVFLLLPLMFLSRRTRKDKNFNALDEMRIPPVLNRALLAVLSLERICIQWGINFPAGGSLLMVAKKTA